MQVSFTPVTQNYYKPMFKAAKKEEEKPSFKMPAKDEMVTAKAKKVFSECRIIALGVVILYFAMKRNFKINKEADILKKETAKKLKKSKAALPKPTPILPDAKFLK
ncbi:MAG: hypothetical protein LUH05_06635 [Candidatus Gastranaerophilales bacterium]|nr:hypothetical protein [Candidatus Gastranaerophilales bacterium]